MTLTPLVQPTMAAPVPAWLSGNQITWHQRVFVNWPQILRVCKCLYLTITKLAQEEALVPVTTLDGGMYSHQ